MTSTVVYPSLTLPLTVIKQKKLQKWETETAVVVMTVDEFLQLA